MKISYSLRKYMISYEYIWFSVKISNILGKYATLNEKYLIFYDNIYPHVKNMSSSIKKIVISYENINLPMKVPNFLWEYVLLHENIQFSMKPSDFVWKYLIFSENIWFPMKISDFYANIWFLCKYLSLCDNI